MASSDHLRRADDRLRAALARLPDTDETREARVLIADARNDIAKAEREREREECRDAA